MNSYHQCQIRWDDSYSFLMNWASEAAASDNKVLLEEEEKENEKIWYILFIAEHSRNEMFFLKKTKRSLKYIHIPTQWAFHAETAQMLPSPKP